MIPRPPDDAPPEEWRKYAEELEGLLAASDRRAQYLQTHLNGLTGSRPWKMLRSMRSLILERMLGNFPRGRRVATTLVREGPGALFSGIQQRSAGDPAYDEFRRKFAFSEAGRPALEAAIQRIAPEARPPISILTPVYNTPANLLEELVQSVRAQVYPQWELCLVDDKSSAPHVRPLLEKLAREDERIRVHFRAENGNICRATQDALEMARGSFVALLDHDDVLTPDALAEMALEIAAHPDAEMLYSDNDMLEMNGSRTAPYFKPDWSPDMFLSNMYSCHLGVYRTESVKAIGGFRVGFEGSQDYDLVLRLIEKVKPEQIRHVPKVLYSWRRVPGSTARNYSAKSYADDAALRALQEAVKRRGIDATVERGLIPSLFRVKRRIAGMPLVSILIPFRDQPALLSRCIQSIRTRTLYERYELILVDNGSAEEHTKRFLETEKKHANVKVLRVDEPFNYARLNNLAARQAQGEHLLLLNNDTEVIEAEWISALLEHSQRNEVGAVGGKLLYPDDRVQHAGVLVGVGEIAGHAHRMCFDDNPGYFGSAAMIRNFSAVTAACMMTRRNVFEELGGLNETDLPVAYNDVDYCLRLREKGYLVVYTPYAKLRHYESASRGLNNNPRESAYMCRRWAKAFRDPYYNPNLSWVMEDFSLRTD